jgi:hypothetical protein
MIRRLLLTAALATALRAQQTIDAVAVISMPVERNVELSGELMPFQQAALRSVSEGVVEKVLVDRGSRVAEGDLLAVLSNAAEIRAPFAGVITARYAHPGELVGPHEGALLDLAQVSRLCLVLSIPEEDAGSIPRGGAGSEDTRSTGRSGCPEFVRQADAGGCGRRPTGACSRRGL